MLQAGMSSVHSRERSVCICRKASLRAGPREVAVPASERSAALDIRPYPRCTGALWRLAADSRARIAFYVFVSK